MSQLRVAVLSIALLATIGFFDRAITAAVALGVLYFIPVALAAWKVNRTMGLFVALLATAIWYFVDVTTRAPHSSAWFDVWNAAARASSFVGIALLVSALCREQRRQAAISAELAKSLEESQRLAARVTELQSELQQICSWTNKIKSEGRWMRFEEFMQRNFQLNFTHGMSEEAARQMSAQIDEAEGKTPLAAKPAR